MTPLRLAPTMFAIAVGMALAAPAARADWQLDGNPVCTATGEQGDLRAIADATGGLILVWREQRRGPTFNDLYAARLLADGSLAPGWPVNGAPVATTGGANPPFIAEDGAGGVFVAWFDVSTFTGRLQRLDATGAVVSGFGANGNAIPFAIGGPGGRHVRIAADGSGGLYMLWNQFDGFIDAVRITRFTSTGAFAPGWGASGVIAGGAAFALGWDRLELQRDPAGGVIVTETLIIEDEPQGFSLLGRIWRVVVPAGPAYLVQVEPSGHNGLPDGHHTVSGLLTVPDGLGGAFATWNTSALDFHAQHYEANASPDWPLDTTLPVVDRSFADDAGGFYALGLPSGSSTLELHRRAADGSTPAGWATGATVTPTGPYNGMAGVTSSSTAFTAWSSGAMSTEDVFASAFTSSGLLAPGWSAGGTTLCDAVGSQRLVALVPGVVGDAYAAWLDGRAGNTDVYALRLLPSGPPWLDVPRPEVGLRLALDRPTPNPARDHVLCTFSLPSAAPASLELVDLTGRRVHAESLAPGAGRQSWSLPTAGLPNGVYFVRLRQSGLVASERVSVIH